MFCAAVALALILVCFFVFRVQVNSYIDEDMRSQIEAIQINSALLIRNEMNYLKQMTASVAQMASHAEIQTDEDILRTLRDFADSANIVRTLFVTLDGHAYTSYGGYLGQSDSDTAIDGIPLSQITEPIFSRAYYSQAADGVIFGVVAPVTLGEKQGVLVSSYNIKTFSRLLKNEFIGGAAEIGIITSKGEVVSGKIIEEFNVNIFDAMATTEFLSSSVDTMRADFARGSAGFSIYQVDGISRYCSYAPIGLNDWYTIVTVKESYLRGQLANLELYGFQLTVTLVIIMLGLLIVIMATRKREQKKIRMILEQAAMMDGLTGLYNRKATEELVEQSLRAGGEDTGAALLVIDVDDFKGINDQGGHLFGDNVLRECASRLSAMFADEGIVGRIGGDEFAVFLPDGRDRGRIEEKIDSLIHHFNILTDTGATQAISISVGIAQVGLRGTSFLLLYQLADDALYRAKQAGKGRISS